MLLVGWFLPNVSPVTPTVAAGLNPAEPCPVVLNPVLLNLLLLNLLLLNLLLLRQPAPAEPAGTGARRQARV